MDHNSYLVIKTELTIPQILQYLIQGRFIHKQDEITFIRSTADSVLQLKIYQNNNELQISLCEPPIFYHS